MDKLKSKEVRQFAKRPDNRSYEVGYAKPPDNRRFKPGKSGNPKGRPKGKRQSLAPAEHERLKSIILEESYRNIKVNDGADQVSVPMAQAVMRSLAVTAAKGNTRAQKLFSELLVKTESARKIASDESLQTKMEYKVDWEVELDRRSRLGITNLPDPLPHPDDIIVDFRRNTLKIHGPMDKRDLADLDLWLTRRHDHEVELKTLLQDKSDPENDPYREQLDSDITYTRRILGIINTALAIRANPNCIQRRLTQLKLKTSTYLAKNQAS